MEFFNKLLAPFHRRCRVPRMPFRVPSGAEWSTWEEYDSIVQYFRDTYPRACFLEFDLEEGYGIPSHSCSMIVWLPVPPMYPRSARKCRDVLRNLEEGSPEYNMLAVLMVEDSWNLGYTDEVVGNEQLMMLNVMVNQAACLLHLVKLMERTTSMNWSLNPTANP